MIAIINLILSLAVLGITLYLFITWKKHELFIKNDNQELTKSINKLEKRLWIVENPPKYKVGDKTPKGWVVYQIDLVPNFGAGGNDWKYSLIKGSKTNIAYGVSPASVLRISSY